jgi:hypothetical protein
MLTPLSMSGYILLMRKGSEGSGNILSAEMRGENLLFS